MKLAWITSKSISDCQDYTCSHPTSPAKYHISHRGHKRFLLWIDDHFIGSYTTLRKAQRIVELIVQG